MYFQLDMLAGAYGFMNVLVTVKKCSLLHGNYFVLPSVTHLDS